MKTKEKKKTRKLLLTVISYLSSKKSSFSLQRKSGNIHTKGKHKVKGIGDHFASLSTYVWIVQKACKECGVVAESVNPSTA